ncbi:MAG TPA: energy transducer TonB, partial [Blastocatellia bacterium]|nr:energy transducer TonB [Blastocatellia bacterium]
PKAPPPAPGVVSELPPLPPVAELPPLTVEFVSVSVPLLKMPPPKAP